jgi:uncharacterized repeat protein (TIGR01451 family)
MNTTRYSWIAAALVAATVTPLAAQQGEPQALVISAQNLMAGDERHQELTDPTALLPGDVVQYRLVFTNVNAVPVRNIALNDPIPSGLRYVGASAAADRDDTVVEFSIDGGVTFAAEPMIEEMVDGKPVLKPAPPERYTHVRWTVQGWVQPGATVTAEFQAQLPSAAAVPDSTANAK